MGVLKAGKLPADLLGSLLARYTHTHPRLLVRPSVGEDAAVIEMGDRVLVAKTDPITFATDAIGWYAVHVNANDIAATGAEPRWFLVTLLLPEGRADEALVEAIFAQLDEACRGLGIVLCGGHTEVTVGLDRPVVVGAMLGEAPADRVVRTGGVQVGDVVVLTKGIAVEGTSILARELEERLRDRFDEAFLARCRRFLYEPGISVVPESRLAVEVATVHAMHDPTEGGVATGLWELAQASGVGLRVEAERLPVFAETKALCEVLGLDPLGLIASGALLIALAEEEVAGLLGAMERAGIPAVPIGRAVPPEEGVMLVTREGELVPLPRFDQDELTRVF